MAVIAPRHFSFGDIHLVLALLVVLFLCFCIAVTFPRACTGLKQTNKGSKPSLGTGGLPLGAPSSIIDSRPQWHARVCRVRFRAHWFCLNCSTPYGIRWPLATLRRPMICRLSLNSRSAGARTKVLAAATAAAAAAAASSDTHDNWLRFSLALRLTTAFLLRLTI